MAQRKTSKQKRQDRKSNKLEAARNREASLRRFLSLLGIDQHIQQPGLRNYLLTCRSQKVTIELDSEIADVPAAISLCDEMKAILRKTIIDCQTLPMGMTVFDYFEYVVPILDHLHHNPNIAVQFPDTITTVRRLTAELETLNTVIEVLSSIIGHLEQASLVPRNRIDHAIYYITVFRFRNDRLQCCVLLKLHRHLAVPLKVKLQGKLRPIFRCGQACWSHNGSGIEWNRWKSSVIGDNSKNVELDIYVQSHVFDRLKERLYMIDCDESLYHENLWQTLKLAMKSPPKAKVIRDPFITDRYLIEFFFHGHRVGYLGAVLCDDRIVITTFLFLTMEGTPEQRMLNERLGVICADIKHLGLDRLSAFVSSDIQFDPKLKAIFEECGCGHLFKILKEPLGQDLIRKKADDVKEYLMLKEGW